MFDVLQVIFWSITYLLIIIYGFLDKENYKPGIPMFVALLNLGWEFNALMFSNGLWAHILWLSLDLLIFSLNVRIAFHKSKSCGLVYVLGIIPVVILFFKLFILPEVNGMLLSSFFLDALIAIEYVFEAKKISIKGKILIAITKLIGDLFAWIAYFDTYVIVAIIGAIVFGLNIYYFYYCLKERKQKEESQSSKISE